MSSYLGSYRELIGGFLDRGYQATKFSALEANLANQLVIRHDIDFDCGYAYQMSLIEDELGVKATYFFMLCSDSYNLLSPENIDYIKQIKANGHIVSIHFDPTIYEDFLAGFRAEREIFESIFQAKIEIVSIHRPNDFFVNYDETFLGVEHTYQSQYFKQIAYISDSQGGFRFGHPFETAAFNTDRSIHLLIHPIWWMSDGDSNIDVLNKFIADRQQANSQHIARNCIPYRHYLEAK